MFVMHQRTQRVLGRWLFVGVCLLPTVAIVTWAFVQSRPGYTESWEASLSRRLGLHIALGQVTHPRPGVTVLHNVRVSDLETHARIARVRVVEAVRGNNGLVLAFSQPLVEGDQADTLWRIMRQQLAGAFDSRRPDVQFAAAELTCEVGDTAITLTDVLGQMTVSAPARLAAFEFRIAGQEMIKPARVRVVRAQHAGEPATRVEFSTEGNELPCSLLSPYTQWARRVGPDCHFCGSCVAQRRREGWEGEVVGRLTRLDLDRLVGDVFPHKLSSEANVTLRKLRFSGSRIRTADGTFSAGPGVLSRSLIHAASDTGLADELRSVAELADTIVPFEQLALNFRISQDGMAVLGACDAEIPGAILTQDDGALLVQPRHQPVPTVALVRALVPQSRVQVPATRETDLLLRVLPIPSIQPAAGVRTADPHLRFGGGVERR
jgi:hypothetical protein